jgi:hypothetical protein
MSPPQKRRLTLDARPTARTDFETVVTDLLDGQYSNPAGIFAFNTTEGWSRDVSADVAAELRRRCDLQLRDVPSKLQDFVDRHDPADRS